MPFFRKKVYNKNVESNNKNVESNRSILKNIICKSNISRIIICWIQVNSVIFHMGFGDLLRGTIYLYNICLLYNIECIVDTHLHPISKFLKNSCSIYSDIIDSNKENIVYQYNEKFYDVNTIELIKNINTEISKKIIDNILYITTNHHHYTNIYYTDSIKLFLKNILTLKDEYSNYIYNNYINKLPENYTVLHIRLKDNIFNNDLSSNNLSKYDNIKEYIENNDIIISNSYNLKKYISEKFNILSYDNKSCHIGLSNNENDILDTIIDLHILINSKKIKTFNEYCWTSNFVNWISKIYDINLVQMKI